MGVLGPIRGIAANIVSTNYPTVFQSQVVLESSGPRAFMPAESVNLGNPQEGGFWNARSF